MDSHRGIPVHTAESLSISIQHDVRTKFMTSSPKLLESVDLAGLHFANRVVLAPMTRARAGIERVPNKIMAEYYTQRASAGLLITEATTISPQANGWNESPGIYTDEMQAGWTQVVDSVHEAGGKIFMQLWHCGRASHPSFHDGEKHVAPSAIAISANTSTRRRENNLTKHPAPWRPLSYPASLKTTGSPRSGPKPPVSMASKSTVPTDTCSIRSWNQKPTDVPTPTAAASKTATDCLARSFAPLPTVFPSNRVGVRLFAQRQLQRHGLA